MCIFFSLADEISIRLFGVLDERYICYTIDGKDFPIGGEGHLRLRQFEMGIMSESSVMLMLCIDFVVKQAASYVTASYVIMIVVAIIC